MGDPAMLNAEIALLYDRCGLRHLTGLKAATPALKATLGAWSDAQIEAFPIVEGPNPQYWGRGCQVTFTHAGKTTVQRGLVVVAGPLRDQLRQARQAGLAELEAALAQLRDKLGQPRLRSVQAVQRRVNAHLRASPAAQFLAVTVYATPTGQINLYWRRNPTALAQVERCDGRYLLVTNDRARSHHEMFRLYRQKDGVEKCFHVSKDDLAISPLYLHQDQRIATMLLINMLALLAYTLLQRQVRQQGLQITTRRLIQRLEPLTLIETHCWDGSTLRRLAHVEPTCWPCSTWWPWRWRSWCKPPHLSPNRTICSPPHTWRPNVCCQIVGCVEPVQPGGRSTPTGRTGDAPRGQRRRGAAFRPQSRRSNSAAHSCAATPPRRRPFYSILKVRNLG